MSNTNEVLFVRHTAVAEKYRPLCYGASDVELSPAGEQHAREVAESLAESAVDRVIHSGLKRARVLAEHLRKLTDCRLEERTGFQERDFGSWELTSWDEIFAEHGDEMLKMISQPETYRPGGSETTYEFVERLVEACHDLHQPGRTVVVCHGGVIAALSGLIERSEISQWMDYVPAHGEICPLDPVTPEHLSCVFRVKEA
jgi:broad specificity phosphatase PhoE